MNSENSQTTKLQETLLENVNNSEDIQNYNMQEAYNDRQNVSDKLKLVTSTIEMHSADLDRMIDQYMYFNLDEQNAQQTFDEKYKKMCDLVNNYMQNIQQLHVDHNNLQNDVKDLQAMINKFQFNNLKHLALNSYAGVNYDIDSADIELKQQQESLKVAVKQWENATMTLEGENDVRMKDMNEIKSKIAALGACIFKSQVDVINNTKSAQHNHTSIQKTLDKRLSELREKVSLAPVAAVNVSQLQHQFDLATTNLNSNEIAIATLSSEVKKLRNSSIAELDINKLNDEITSLNASMNTYEQNLKNAAGTYDSCTKEIYESLDKLVDITDRETIDKQLQIHDKFLQNAPKYQGYIDDNFGPIYISYREACKGILDEYREQINDDLPALLNDYKNLIILLEQHMNYQINKTNKKFAIGAKKKIQKQKEDLQNVIKYLRISD